MSAAHDINDANVVVGGGSKPWVGTETIGNVPLSGSVGAGAFGINNSGEIVGSSFFTNILSACYWGPAPRYAPAQGRLFYRAPVDLNRKAAVPDGFTLTKAVRINNKGQILCFGLKGNEERAFLLTPRLRLNP